MNILVVGGAGYIGSHMVKWLDRLDHVVTIFDNLSSGHREAVVAGRLVVGDLNNRELLDRTFTEGGFEAVLHFASHIEVAESVADPGKYYHNNVANTLNLLDAMVKHDVRYFIFSSSAAVYGLPDRVPISEAQSKRPINPYGLSKWMVEQVLADYERAHGLKFVCLRYFNAAGADPEGELGERHTPESHLIPLVLQAASGRRPHITIFGTDYDTPDGTCIRDYVHVSDLCNAHLLALERLKFMRESAAYNLGNGTGFSIREVIDTACKVSGQKIPLQFGGRRQGDPARLVADAVLAHEELGWRPIYSDLGSIIQHAWQWECKLAHGAGSSRVRY